MSKIKRVHFLNGRLQEVKILSTTERIILRILVGILFVMILALLFFLGSEIIHHKYSLIFTTTEYKDSGICNINDLGRDVIVSYNNKRFVIENFEWHEGWSNRITMQAKELKENPEPSERDIKIWDTNNCRELPYPHPQTECLNNI